VHFLKTSATGEGREGFKFVILLDLADLAERCCVEPGLNW
jgi:hypothetical protein